jgi:hypothetical protein
MRDGVFWHFDSHDGGYIEVDKKGYWGDIVLASNDLLFLAADIVPPSDGAQFRADVHSAELSNAELFHRRLGHPGRTATKFLAAKGLIPKEAAGALPEPCLTCAVSKGSSIPRSPIMNPATRPLQKLHIDLISV